ncbi:MAG TPA: hypothetical protein VMH26_16125 [Burkholderiales bacterium]|nr:hypothetical protein [Burkholderiales bacterium]
MSDISRNGRYLVCPLCQGKGKMHRSELAATLANHAFETRLADCRRQLLNSDESLLNAAEKDFRQEVLKGPVTRILWRRSSKE